MRYFIQGPSLAKQYQKSVSTIKTESKPKCDYTQNDRRTRQKEDNNIAALPLIGDRMNTYENLKSHENFLEVQKKLYKSDKVHSNLKKPKFSDVFNQNEYYPKPSSKENYLKTSSNYSPIKKKNYFESDVFHTKNDPEMIKTKTGEGYLLQNQKKVYSAVTHSGSEWIPRDNHPNLINHSSVQHSILSPNIKGNSKTKPQIFKESANYNPANMQKSISEFTHLSRVFGSHNNVVFSDAIKTSTNTFNQTANVCNSYYKSYKSYEALSLKPFTQNKFI